MYEKIISVIQQSQISLDLTIHHPTFPRFHIGFSRSIIDDAGLEMITHEKILIADKVRMLCPICHTCSINLYFTDYGVLNCENELINPKILSVCHRCYNKIQNNLLNETEQQIYAKCLGGH